MANTKIGLGNSIGTRFVEFADLNATAENDVLSGAATLHEIYVDNTGNTAATFAKFYNAAAPTIGTTAPDIIVRSRASVKTRVYMAPGLGISFATGLSGAGLTAAGTAGTTGPTNDVVARVRVS